jgi:MoxR-like ATPase
VADDASLLEHALYEVRKVILGQDRLVERLLVALLARGHLLLEGPPGVAKTLAAETLATVVGGTFARVQFTPDLLPADITGTRISLGELAEVYADTGGVVGHDEVDKDVSGWFVGGGLGLLALTGSLSLLWSQRLP